MECSSGVTAERAGSSGLLLSEGKALFGEVCW